MAYPKHDSVSALVAHGFFRDLDSFSELEDRITALPTATERGNAFEVFADQRHDQPATPPV